MADSRRDIWDRLFPDAPAYRFLQCEKALFTPGMKSWSDVTALPKDVRETLVREMPWWSVRPLHIYKSKRGDTYKAVLVGADDRPFETVLMENVRDQWTICVSSQIGCAMRCTFCATGKMGLKRSLLADEIVDQMRFWRQFLANKPNLPQRISNVVFMGMGEPLANYDAVKETVNVWLRETDIGPTHITVSSVGVLAQLERLIDDPTWPPVRIAISLHSANQQRREEIVPTTVPDFLKKLSAWSHRYQEHHGTRKHHVTYEYVLLEGVNDTPELAQELAQYIRTTGVSKVNLIPWNPVDKISFERSTTDRIELFVGILRGAGVEVTVRKTMGDDIDAACGQLANTEASPTQEV